MAKSLQSFCLSNNVPYNIFSKWYKDTRRKVVEVEVDGRPLEKGKEKSVQSSQDGVVESLEKHLLPSDQTKNGAVRIWLELRLSNGLYLSRKNLNYQELRSLIEKLEVLC